jgi:hypothetical protein
MKKARRVARRGFVIASPALPGGAIQLDCFDAARRAMTRSGYDFI